MSYELDDSRWPLVILRVVGSVTRDEEVEFTERSTRLPERRERYAVIVDLTEAGTPTPRFVRLQASAQKLRADGLATYCVGIAFVIGSPMLRGALKAILHLQSLPCPQTVVASMPEAHLWADAKQAARTS